MVNLQNLIDEQKSVQSVGKVQIQVDATRLFNPIRRGPSVGLMSLWEQDGPLDIDHMLVLHRYLFYVVLVIVKKVGKQTLPSTALLDSMGLYLQKTEWEMETLLLKALQQSQTPCLLMLPLHWEIILM